MNIRRWRTALISIALFLLAFIALVTMGALFGRMRFLTRGIPDELPDPIPNGGVRLGINTYLEKYDSEQLEENLNEIEKLGFSAIKQPFYFSDKYDWAASDEIVQNVVDAGFILVPVLDGDPTDDFAPPEDPLQFAQWTRAFAERYGEVIDHYFIWDEPNLAEHWGGQNVNPAEYAALLSAAGANIRAVDPEAVIITAPLAPTVETGPRNISDHLYLQALYESGVGDAFDVVGGKPYGFDSGPEYRTVDPASLNFSRLILLREVMERNGDSEKAIWAGNWGWNSLPDDWQGAPSIWGQVDESMRARWLEEAVERARREWPWMGFMFVENWEPNAPKSDPRWGFSIAGSDTADRLARFNEVESLAYPGFYLADPDHPSQEFEGGGVSHLNMALM